MTSLDNIVLKEHLKRSLPGKSDKLRCFERVLTDEASGGKSSPEEAYFLLVGESIYFSDVKCSSMRLAVSLRDVADIAIVKTPRLGLAEEYRVQTLLITCRSGAEAEDADDELDDEDGAEDGGETHRNGAGRADEGSPSSSSDQHHQALPTAAENSGDGNSGGGGGGCFGRGRSQARQRAAAAEASQTIEPLPPLPPPADETPGQPQQRSGGCLPRRRQNPPPPAADTSSSPNQQQQQQQQANGDSSPAPTGVPTATSAADAAAPATVAAENNDSVRSFRILCNVFSSSRSVAYLHLRNTWQMATLLGTLDMDEEFVESTLPATPNGRREKRRRRRVRRPPASLSSAHLTQLFRELRADILRTQGSMQEAFGFLFELKLSLDRGYPVKKLFWETDDLFRCIVNKLFYFLNKDPALLQGRVTSPAAIRLDELDYCLLSLQILSAVFLDTEFMIERRKATATQQHYFMQRMLRACAVQIRPCVANFVYDPAKSRPDHRLTGQLHVERAALLHHIITYLRTGISAWSSSAGGGGGGLPLIGRSDGSIVSESQVVELLAAEGDGLLIMLTESVRLLCHRFDTGGAAAEPVDEDETSDRVSSHPASLQPLAVVEAYYLLFVINSVINYSNSAREHLIRQHREDFRFFISEHRIRIAVRPELPIFPGLLELAKQVRQQLGVL